MSDKLLVGLIPAMLLGMVALSGCDETEDIYVHLNTEYYSDTDTIIFYNYNGSGYYDLSGDKEICDYSGNNVYVDTELVGTFVNYYAFQMGSANCFMKGETK